MMIGHLTVAGLAESVISAGVVPGCSGPTHCCCRPPRLRSLNQPDNRRRLRATKPLWIALAVLMVSHRGILAAGSAWGNGAGRLFEPSAPNRSRQPQAKSCPQPARRWVCSAWLRSGPHPCLATRRHSSKVRHSATCFAVSNRPDRLRVLLAGWFLVGARMRTCRMRAGLLSERWPACSRLRIRANGRTTGLRTRRTAEDRSARKSRRFIRLVVWSPHPPTARHRPSLRCALMLALLSASVPADSRPGLDARAVLYRRHRAPASS